MSSFLPSWIPPSVSVSRPTADEINSLAAMEQTVTVSGYNEPVPFVYGEQQVSGPLLTTPTMSGNSLIYAVAIARVQSGKAIGGYTGIMINGVAQAAPPNISTNPTTFSSDGYAFRLYDGTQSTPDATLRTAFGAEFNDHFPNTAYVVISVPAAKANDFTIGSSVVWTVKGRQCFDPRDSSWGWTENPSLHLRDFITCQEYGLGRGVIGAEDCADWNDVLYNGLPQARTGLILNEPLDEGQALDLLAVYAEALWSYEGDKIRLIPDAPATEIHTITKDLIRDDTFDISGAGLSDTPTALSIIYSDRSRPTEWGSIPAHVQSADHELYGSTATQSDVQLPGVYRTVEAERRAWSRFQRLQSVGRISFQMFDDGVLYQLGDVLRVPDHNGLDTVLIRLTSMPEPVELGLYQLHGEIYKSDFYPTGKGGAVVPDGALVFMANDNTPDGYAVHYAGEDIPVMGGSTNSIAAEVGAPTGVMSVSLATAGGHTGSQDLTTSLWMYADEYNRRVTGYTAGSGQGNSAHSHSASVSLSGRFKGVFHKPREVVRLLKKQASPAVGYAPDGMLFLSVLDIAPEGFSRYQTDGVLKVGNTARQMAADAGPQGVSSSPGGAHGHQANSAYENPVQPRGDTSKPITAIYTASFAPAHSHVVYGANVIEQNLKMKTVTVYRSQSENALLPEGAILGFDGEEIPEGWALCDGANGTPDLNSGFFVEGVKEGAGGGETGAENNILIGGLSGSSYAGQHSHSVSQQALGRWAATQLASNHGNADGGHSHPTSTTPDRSFNFVPKHHKIQFIQFIGS